MTALAAQAKELAARLAEAPKPLPPPSVPTARKASFSLRYLLAGTKLSGSFFYGSRKVHGHKAVLLGHADSSAGRQRSGTVEIPWLRTHLLPVDKRHRSDQRVMNLWPAGIFCRRRSRAHRNPRAAGAAAARQLAAVTVPGAAAIAATAAATASGALAAAEAPRGA